MSAQSFDIVVLGAGIAGAGIAAFLATRRRVALVEAEDEVGRHATGRSAAMFIESYGGGPVRALTHASRAFFDAPPEGFCETPLLSPRGCLTIAEAGDEDALEALAEDPVLAGRIRRLSAAEAQRLCPILEPGRIAGAVLEAESYDIDVAAHHAGFLRLFRRAGGTLLTGAGYARIARQAGEWRITTRAGELAAPILVDAAGAWADETAAGAGVRPIGLQPKRRTVIIIPAPDNVEIRDWPTVLDARERFYFKPDAGRLLLSPCNEDDAPPADVAPEELDVALAIDRFERATSARVARVLRRWAGLRTFAPDRVPVVGFDPLAEGFFWLAGQGGFGIQTSPALSRLAAELVLGEDVPPDIIGIDPAELSPARFARG